MLDLTTLYHPGGILATKDDNPCPCGCNALALALAKLETPQCDCGNVVECELCEECLVDEFKAQGWKEPS